ncbi:hypothetical protein [Crocosphaera sp. Alani8]|uniref:hypothetical protein n=1 Tax=Crocosphaera sp. Alani8 TaxID=3038952 RepID=UPI00313DE6A0
MHTTAIDFIQRFIGKDLSDRNILQEFSDQVIFSSWLKKQYPHRSQEIYRAMLLVARPYFEYKDTPVFVVPYVDTLFITGSSDSSISFIRPSSLGTQKQLILDIPHAGTLPPSCVDGLLSDQVIADESITSSNPYTIWNQADVGVLEVSGSIWQNHQNFVCGSAVLTNLIISNGNRAPAREGRTNQVYNTHTYRGTPLYKDISQPTDETKLRLKRNHDLSIAVAGACRAAAYVTNGDYPIICLEPHSYSAFSHEILDALFSPQLNGLNLTKFAPHNGGTHTKALLDYLRNTYDKKSYQELVRPLVSVLDVSSPDEPDKYSTVNQSEMEAFVDPFITMIEEASNMLPINLDDWEKSRPDVYGATSTMLIRLEEVIKKANYYLDINDDNVIPKTINTVTIEYNRGLVTSNETSNIHTSEEDFYKRCQLVGEAFVAGIKNMQNMFLL